MKVRTHTIFEAAVRDFIETGQPVTSQNLYNAYDFGIKPAMIRWELNRLCSGGYFYQTYPSGGRLPTNKAYRFFVRELLRKEQVRTPAAVEHLVSSILEGELKSCVEMLAHDLKLLSVGYASSLDSIFESGLRCLLGGLEFEKRDALLEVVGDVELLPKQIVEKRSWWQAERRWPQVFVGGSPFTRSKHISVVAHRFATENGDVFFLAMGPRRMDYGRSLGLFRSLQKSLEEERG